MPLLQSQATIAPSFISSFYYDFCVICHLCFFFAEIVMMVVRHRGKVLKDLLLNNSTKSFNVWIRNIDTNELFGLNSDQAEI